MIFRKKNDKKRSIVPSSNINLKLNRKKRYEKKRALRRINRRVMLCKAFVKISLICLILYGLSRLAVCSIWYFPQDIFSGQNPNLIINGANITPKEVIIKELQAEGVAERPFYLVSPKKYEKRLEKLSPVNKVFIRRFLFPTRFEVNIDEKIPQVTIATSPTSPEIAAISTDGSIISKEFLPINTKKYHTYKILTTDNYTKWSKDEILYLLTLAERLEDYSSERLLYLDIRDKNDVYAELETTKIRIGKFDYTLKDRIKKLTSIMPQIENLKSKTQYIDLRWDNPILKQKTTR